MIAQPGQYVRWVHDSTVSNVLPISAIHDQYVLLKHDRKVITVPRAELIPEGSRGWWWQQAVKTL